MASTSNPSRPSYPTHPASTTSSTSSSATSSAYQSSNSLPSIGARSPTSVTSHQSAVPLPSPTSQYPPSHHHQYSSMHPSQVVQSQRQSGGATGFDYRPDRAAAGRTAAETGQFLRDYNLVAEAAKRAQMAVLARDLDAMEF